MTRIILPFLHLLRKIISVFIIHAIPQPRPAATTAYQRFQEDERDDCYNHFKKYFYDSIFLEKNPLREYSLKRALQHHKMDYYYLEFGVHTGASINFFASILKDITIYGFDSFEGLKEDWVGTSDQAGRFNLNKNIPKLSTNVVPIVGWVQDSLVLFISEKTEFKINFVHMDLDTYESTKFVLNTIKPHLVEGAIILFDELYNYSGWKVGEYKALTEEFDEDEYKFVAFSITGAQVAIKYK